jgi:tetratricopeptide (TPR) repeat protein
VPRCPVCSQDNPEVARFCLACGSALERLGDVGNRASAAANLALALADQGRYEEAIEISRVSEELAAPDDADPQVRFRVARSLAFLGVGRLEEAERLARKALAVAAETDMLWEQGEALTTLGRVLLATGRIKEAEEVLGGALETYRRKGMVVSEARAQRLLDDAHRVGS